MENVLRQGSLFGAIEVNAPDVLVGYARGSSLQNDTEDTGHRQEISTRSVLQVHATTEPLTIVPPKSRPQFSCTESELIVARVEQWYQSLGGGADQDGQRSVFWSDVRGSSYLVSRFLTEQQTPHGFDSLASCARYVSLIPSSRAVQLNALGGRDDSMVLTSQQVLSILSGTRQEHAILLVNFFMHLAKRRPAEFAGETFLVVGLSPEGKTVSPVGRSVRTICPASTFLLTLLLS